jgi:transposase InsO family protein
MIDPATSWFEIKSITNKSAITVAEAVEQTWLTRYPRPSQLTYDRGSEFLGEFAKMIVNDYGIIKKPLTTRNPQANAIIERIHKTLGNMLRTFELNEIEVPEDQPWNGILAAIMYAIRATYHTTLKATPTQLVFGRDAILNMKFEANWQNIKENKQRIIDRNNKKENAKRIPHLYKAGDLVLWKQELKRKYGVSPYKGPFKILRIHDNGTVRLKYGAIIDTVNIRQIKPYRK